MFTWAQLLADFVTFKILNLPSESYTGKALNFFIYDLFKIGFMLLVINFFMAYVRYALPVGKIKQILLSRKWYGLDYLLAAILGVITPFCSCSSIPLFIGFLAAGIPLGITATFLIASPLINEASLALFPALFGLKITLIYNLLGIAIAILGGFVIAKLRLDNYVNSDFLNIKVQDISEIKTARISRKLIKEWGCEGFALTSKVFPYLVIGIGIGALIHGFVPANYFESVLKIDSVLAVPIATLLGLPLYANSISIIPIMQALITKGVPLGTALSFMTATVALSIPEALILKKVMKWQLLAAYFTVTTLGIMLMGYILNLI